MKQIKQVTRGQNESEVLKDVGEITISRTQKYRVLIVRQDGKVVVSAQKWWRANTDEDWAIGKGFILDSKESNMLGTLLLESSSILRNYS